MICPYCDEIIEDSGVSVGGEILHSHCHQDLGEEMDAAWPEEEEGDELAELSDEPENNLTEALALAEFWEVW